MEDLIKTVDYLKTLGYSTEDMKFQEMVNLHVDITKVITASKLYKI